MAKPLTEARAFTRYDTDVSVILIARSIKVNARMLSVSAGGALVRMDRLSAKVFDADAFLIEITGVGRFSVQKKWRRDTDIGTSFQLSDADRRRLADRLADRYDPMRPQVRRFADNAPQP